MVVYLDLVILSALLADYAILKTISVVFKEKVIVWRFIVALIFSTINLLLFLFPLKHFMVLRYLSGIVIVFIAYPFHSIQDKIIRIVVFYFLNIAFIGTIVIFKIRNIMMLGVALLYVIVCWIIENYKNVSINENQQTYSVKIGDKKLKGYLDTGNTVYHQGIPVIFLNDKYYLYSIFKKIDEMKIQGIQGESKMDIYNGPLLFIGKESYIVHYAFSNIGKWDVLLHCEFQK